ncbi:MAG: polyprenyl synthetase family protein [Bacteroidales bacterium]|nr:polyprenyl synthetase family protein [Bacteroidales bacterium]
MITESQINETLKSIFSEIQFPSEPNGLYEPLRYMIQIGGKRVRPGLCLTSYSLFQDSFNEGITSPATALEVFHSFTLMHDDIMDRSPLRRGVDTVWKKWDENTAILSGDVMLIDAYKRIAKAPACVLDKVTQSFSKMGAEVCEGQQYDMEFESQDYVTMEQYLQMIGLKTAVLIACSAKIGAIIGGASESQCQALYDYGYQLGLAFQVADDYLDAFGDEKVFGKPIGGDILNCKKSWLTVRALEKIDNKERFLEAFNSQAETPEQKAEKIKKVKDMYIELGIDADAKKEIEMFTEKSLEAAANAGFNEEQIEVLRKFTVKLVGRAK